MLELNDFISTVAHFEDDYEIYCMMKDKVNLSNSTFGLDVKVSMQKRILGRNKGEGELG